MVLAALGGRHSGSSLQVHAPTLISRIQTTLTRTDVVVFVDEPLPDEATIHVVETMLDHFGSECGLVRSVPVIEAIKRLQGGVVAEGIDRSSLFYPKPPEIMRRTCLEKAILTLSQEQWVCPSAVLLSSGATIEVFDESQLVQQA